MQHIGSSVLNPPAFKDTSLFSVQRPPIYLLVKIQAFWKKKSAVSKWRSFFIMRILGPLWLVVILFTGNTSYYGSRLLLVDYYSNDNVNLNYFSYTEDKLIISVEQNSRMWNFVEKNRPWLKSRLSSSQRKKSCCLNAKPNAPPQKHLHFPAGFRLPARWLQTLCFQNSAVRLVNITSSLPNRSQVSIRSKW